jgi:retinol dehydrogenase-12
MTSSPLDLSGQTAIVTGANTGIGRVTALELARMGAHVFLACRSQERTLPVVEAISTETGNPQVEFLHLDLASLTATRDSAQNFLARDLPLHILVNNAGLAGVAGMTVDGFEITFGVNHLGHFLFTLLLLERLQDSTPARIVHVSSRAHTRPQTLDLEIVRLPRRSFLGRLEYSESKLANILFHIELADRLEGTGVTTYALHPGVIASDFWRMVPQPLRWFLTRPMITNEEGAQTTLHCATAPQLAKESGLYYDDCQVEQTSEAARDRELAALLWKRSEEWCTPFLGNPKSNRS